MAAIEMELESPLPLVECLAILREQVGVKRRIRLLPKYTSRVVGRVDGVDDTGISLSLEAAADRFSKRLVGQMHPTDAGTRFVGRWVVPFLSQIYGDHEFDKEEIVEFLREYCRFTAMGKLTTNGTNRHE